MRTFVDESHVRLDAGTGVWSTQLAPGKLLPGDKYVVRVRARRGVRGQGVGGWGPWSARSNNILAQPVPMATRKPEDEDGQGSVRACPLCGCFVAAIIVDEGPLGVRWSDERVKDGRSKDAKYRDRIRIERIMDGPVARTAPEVCLTAPRVPL